MFGALSPAVIVSADVISENNAVADLHTMNDDNIVYMLNEFINHFFERFKQVKSSLIKQIGTIERAQEFNKVENLKRTPQKTSKRG